MMYLKYFIVLLFGCAGVLTQIVPLCKLRDARCLQDHDQELYIKVLSAIPELGTEELDPMFLEVIDAKLPGVNYKFYNTTLTGFKQCTIDIFEANEKTLSIYTKLLCPGLKLYGTYEMYGKILGQVPVDGYGDYVIETNEYLIEVNANLEEILRSGKKYLAIKNYNVKAEALQPFKLNFQNIYNGNKELADAAHNFVDENSVEVANSLHHPCFVVYFEKIFKNFDKIVGQVTADKLL